MNAGTYSHASNYGGPVSQGQETGSGHPGWSAGAPPTPVRVDPSACVDVVGVGRKNGVVFCETFAYSDSDIAAQEQTSEASKDPEQKEGFAPEPDIDFSRVTKEDLLREWSIVPGGAAPLVGGRPGALVSNWPVPPESGA